jgi:hypothetical protein
MGGPDSIKARVYCGGAVFRGDIRLLVRHS